MKTINHIGISGGKDSTALLLWAVHESGYPRESLDVTFCNTHNEHPLTYAYIAMLSQKVHPVKWLEPKLGFFDLARKKKRFPSRRARFCTQELKMKPTQEHVLKLLDENTTVILHSGVRKAESIERAKLPKTEFDPYFGLTVFRPLLDWSIEDVWKIHHKYGIAPNPLYKMGAKRVGCFPCINSRKSEINLMSRLFPEIIDKLRQEEQTFDNINGMSTFFARKTVPLIQRSKEITTKNGTTMKVATIDDVVRWSKTVRGGKQYALGPWAEEDFNFDDQRTCPSTLGVCE